eukprot:15151999-Alexandrium_andersonii.AAC.1
MASERPVVNTSFLARVAPLCVNVSVPTVHCFMCECPLSYHADLWIGTRTQFPKARDCLCALPRSPPNAGTAGKHDFVQPLGPLQSKAPWFWHSSCGNCRRPVLAMRRLRCT